MSTPDQELVHIKTELLTFAESIGGWDYEDDESATMNMMRMTATLIKAVQDRDARINRLLLKLGQAAEKL